MTAHESKIYKYFPFHRYLSLCLPPKSISILNESARKRCPPPKICFLIFGFFDNGYGKFEQCAHQIRCHLLYYSNFPCNGHCEWSNCMSKSIRLAYVAYRIYKCASVIIRTANWLCCPYHMTSDNLFVLYESKPFCEEFCNKIFRKMRFFHWNWNPEKSFDKCGIYNVVQVL